MRPRLLRAALLAAIACAGVLGSAQVKDFTPVTDAILRNPDPSDWLHWRRTYDAWGYSPLDQINRETVGALQLAWSWAMEPGDQQTTPLVYDGVMYLAHPGAVLQALNAATGDLLWEYRRKGLEGPAARGRPGRNLALYEDRVFMTTADGHVVAIDARTGTEVWDVQFGDSTRRFSFSAGPLAVAGKVIASFSGCSRYVKEKCAIVALDVRTGRELWRTPTIAGPDDPGGDTWGDLPDVFRAGTDMWVPGSYDPALGLIYWSTSQAKPWTRFNRGTDGDALYSNSTLALDPDTGEIVWYHQFIPGDTLDHDEVFESVLVDVGPQKSLFKMGKIGVLWQLDRASGGFVKASDLGYQTVARIDAAAGKAIHRPDVVPKPDQPVDICPDISGFKAQFAMAYSPETRAFYVPLEMLCSKIAFPAAGERVEGRGGGGGWGQRDFYIHPAAGGQLAEFLAMDSVTGRVLWRHRQRAQLLTAALTTGGGLVFVGDYDRYFRAFDIRTGAVLWETRTATSPKGFPVTYAVGDRQYVAVPVGVGGAGWSTTIPAALTPDIKRPNAGNAVYVFALPAQPR